VGEETDVLVSLAVSRPPAPRLRLRAGACEVFVEDERPSVRLGRQPHNDLVVEGRGVSRTHARVELRHGHFVLIDESTNGCLVRAEGKAAIHVRHDEIRLSARGSIALGGDPQPAGENVVDYERLEASGGDRGA
jgi:adenylate cyclase